jgi:hypothetical protein
MINAETGLKKQYNRKTRKRIAILCKRANAANAAGQEAAFLAAEAEILRIVRKERHRT